jgi:L-cysteate sulfo-lyase
VETVDLGVWRTPLEPAPRLSERIGLRRDDLWIKRDDWIGHGGGGNKLRKLEYLCARAIDEGADTLVTSGAAQSNYCRLTAASARRLGLHVVLVLAGHGDNEGTGNLTLDGIFNADIRWGGDVAPSQLQDAVQLTADALRAAGRRPASLPFGGSDACGALGYLACARELQQQAPDARHVVAAVGSGGTMAGLVAGLGADTRPALRFDATQIGPGYELLTPSATKAIHNAGECEGLILDPVHGAKAFAGLTHAIADNEIEPGQRTIYVHTGGLPGLFGHAVAQQLADSTRE